MKPSIFYFDDEVVHLDIFREMFGDEYDVLIASGLLEARRIMSEYAPDIIISDWSMPEISGVEFLREAATTHPSSFRVMVTGVGQVGDVITEIISGLVQLFITKPWNEAEMRRALERALQMRSRTQS